MLGLRVAGGHHVVGSALVRPRAGAERGVRPAAEGCRAQLLQPHRAGGGSPSNHDQCSDSGDLPTCEGAVSLGLDAERPVHDQRWSPQGGGADGRDNRCESQAVNVCPLEEGKERDHRRPAASDDEALWSTVDGRVTDNQHERHERCGAQSKESRGHGTVVVWPVTAGVWQGAAFGGIPSLCRRGAVTAPRTTDAR